MKSLKAVLAQVVGLFVDDGWFALAILVWLAAAWLVLPRLGLQPGWAGLILFAGLGVVLLESSMRRAWR